MKKVTHHLSIKDYNIIGLCETLPNDAITESELILPEYQCNHPPDNQATEALYTVEPRMCLERFNSSDQLRLETFIVEVVSKRRRLSENIHDRRQPLLGCQKKCWSCQEEKIFAPLRILSHTGPLSRRFYT